MPTMQWPTSSLLRSSARTAITRGSASLLRPAQFTALNASTTSSVSTYLYWCQTPIANRSTPTVSPSICNHLPPPTAARISPQYLKSAVLSGLQDLLMDQIHFLSHEELCTLTGAKTKAGRITVSKRNGIRYTIKRSGWPCVIESALAGEAVTTTNPSKPKWQPRLVEQMGRKPIKPDCVTRLRKRKQRSGVVYYYYDIGGSPRKEIPLCSDYGMLHASEIQSTESRKGRNVGYLRSYWRIGYDPC